MLKLLLAAAILLAAAGGAAYWTFARDDGAEAGVEVVRWGNVTVQVTEDSGVAAVQGFAPAEIKPPAGGLVLILNRRDSSLVIDADTGKVIQDAVQAADRAAIDQVASTLVVKAFDEKAAPWPYSSTPPPSTTRERVGSITFIPPAPGSGLEVYIVVNDGLQGSFVALQLKNGRSSLSINAETGITASADIATEDAEAFDRFLSAVQVEAVRE